MKNNGSGVSLFLLTPMVFCLFSCSQSKNASDIFADSINCVFEVMAKDDDGNASFGSSVVISESKAVTNFHVISHNVDGALEIYSSIQIRSPFEDTYHEVMVDNMMRTMTSQC